MEGMEEVEEEVREMWTMVELYMPYRLVKGENYCCLRFSTRSYGKRFWSIF